MGQYCYNISTIEGLQRRNFDKTLNVNGNFVEDPLTRTMHNVHELRRDRCNAPNVTYTTGLQRRKSKKL